jgi:hypothetical protein
MATRTPTKFTREAAQRRRVKQDEGFEFILENTLDEDGNPFSVRARIPSPHNPDDLMRAPADLQRYIFDVMSKAEKAGPEAMNAPGIDPDDFEANIEKINEAEDAIRFYIVMGFVEPRAYSTVEEAEEQGGIWWKDVEYFDRVAFVAHCTSQTKAVAAAVKPFRAGQDGVVHNPPAGKDVSGDGRSKRNRRTATVLANEAPA